MDRIKNVVLDKLSSSILAIWSMFSDLCLLSEYFITNDAGEYIPDIDSAELKITQR